MPELLFGSAVFVASLLAGAGIAGSIPLRRTSDTQSVCMALAIGMSPFCLGSAALIVMCLAPGIAPRAHLLLVLAILLVVIIVLRRKIPAAMNGQSFRAPAMQSLLGVCVLAALATGFAASHTPFTQNDALEYAWMGRLLYETGTLAVLPAVEPLANQYGTYLPWTHPPLYPVMLYLASAVQGGTATVGLGRFIAPWFFVAAVSCTFAVGFWNGVRSAALAALLLAAVPLLLLGSATGLIDALPVAAFSVLLALTCWAGGSRWHRAVLAGVALGASLYTHSVAVLFIPMFALAWAWRWGLHAPFRRLREIGVALLIAFAIAVWPYLRNLLVLGTIIGDNPDVFRIQSQAWGDYFTIMRGIDRPLAVLQYGLLKGWFALEAYGATFWLMLLGLFALLRSLRRRPDWFLFSRTGSPGHKAALLSALLVGAYHAGALVLTMTGDEILIKNERYLLSILPAVAVVTASLAGRWSGHIPNTGSTYRGLVSNLALATAAVQMLVCLAFAATGMSVAKSGIASGVPREAADPAITPLWIVREELRASHGVLSMRPADLYYVGSRMVSLLDPRMRPFYELTSADAGFAELQRLGIRHVHLPESHLPPVFNSRLSDLLADPSRFTLISSGSGTRVFRIGDSGLRVGETTDISPAVVPWTRTQNLVVGGRQALARIELGQRRLSSDGLSVAPGLGGLFNRDRSVSIISPVLEASHCAEHLLHYAVSGYGKVRVLLHVQSSIAQQAASGRHQIADFFLSATQPRRNLISRIVVPSESRHVRVEIEHIGQSMVKIESVELKCLSVPRDSRLPSGIHQ